jgi:glycosyltransferase involved in cell wall biosynthesis
MTKNEILIYSLTTSYVRSDNLKRSHFVHVLNNELVKNRISVTTITLHQKGSFKNETRDGVKIRRFKYLPERFELNETSIPEASRSASGKFKIIIMSISFFIFTFSECIKQKPDILHAHWAFPSGYIAFLLSRIFRKKFIVTIHGSDIALLKKYTLIKKFVIPNLNKSSQIIANSEYAKKELITMGINENKIIKIRVPPDFVEHEKDPKILEKFREKFTDSSTKIILFVGRLVEVKGVEYLIKALPEIKNVNIHLIIAGDGPLKNKLQM